MVTAAILAAILGAGCIVCIMTLYALHRLTGGKMSMKKWFHLNFDFSGGKRKCLKCITSAGSMRSVLLRK